MVRVFSINPRAQRLLKEEYVLVSETLRRLCTVHAVAAPFLMKNKKIFPVVSLRKILVRSGSNSRSCALSFIELHPYNVYNNLKICII